MNCAICGNEIINENISRDHVFPRAIYKWQEESLSIEEFRTLKSAIESSSNIVKTHHSCNISKEDNLIDVSSLFLSPKKKELLETKALIIQPYLSGYLEIKDMVLARQNNCCLLCQKPLSDDRILRRLDSRKARTLDNACILCHECNRSVDRNPIQ